MLTASKPQAPDVLFHSRDVSPYRGAVPCDRMAGTAERNTMKTIVVGYDGTDTAARAAGEGATLARALSAELHIIGVVDDERVRQGMTTAEAQEALHAQAVARNQALLDEMAGELDTVTTVNKSLPGSPAWAIVDYATEVNADVIVLGNKHVQGLSRVLGSVAVDVLRHAPCSVYVANTR